jgi:hypothetical protein
MSRVWIRAGVVLAAVFSTGVLAGMVGYHHGLGHFRQPASGSPAMEHEAAMAELRDELGLDEQQLAQVQAIMAEHQETVDQMWAQLRPEVQAAMRQVHEEIAALLRPDQVDRFHEWLSHAREHADPAGH